MSNGIAADQIRAFVDRILRLKDEEDGLKTDVRDIYAEAKAMGFDKTALGSVVSHVRKRVKDSAGLEERTANFDLYLGAYDNAPRTHTHTREGE